MKEKWRDITNITIKKEMGEIMSRTKKFAFMCERKLLIVTLMAFFLSIFVAANAPAEMYWKDYNGEEPGGYMPDIDQNQDFANVLAIDEHFSGGPGPHCWFAYLWNPGGTVTVSGGLLTVDGSLAYTNALYGPGHTLEFVATFKAQPFQAVGFGAPSPPDPMFNGPPWIISRYGPLRKSALCKNLSPLGCTFNTGDDAIALGAGYLGSAHHYRIDWKTNGIDFYIDGVLKVSRAYSIPQSMRVGISELPTWWFQSDG